MGRTNLGDIDREFDPLSEDIGDTGARHIETTRSRLGSGLEGNISGYYEQGSPEQPGTVMPNYDTLSRVD